jgi:hypothetical protein
MAQREGFTSAAFVLPETMANFCFNCQRYQSLATVRTCILPVFLENQIAHILVAMVVSPAFPLAQPLSDPDLILGSRLIYNNLHNWREIYEVSI